MQGPWVATQDGAQWFIGAPVSDTLPAHAARHIGNAYNEANARLIAAAPDLLAALETALPWLIKADIDGAFDGCALPLGGRKAWEQIERAIVKAKGN
jgi:hypothetical protein